MARRSVREALRDEIRFLRLPALCCFGIGYLLAFPWALRAALKKYPKEAP